ncbi:hypothetical protein MOQ72_43860 [Saccharopolyspora sp. K220]|uniref:hypothetical protein n=1 Tax=Saccharopolyspora soli TaxID=2926618 RepID=UPI001F5A30FC|nr:hypothetical protein [Saccharopolyspora soli]MCI2424344.1 hypothetical protein [Saccharopolyspora soli]
MSALAPKVVCQVEAADGTFTLELQNLGDSAAAGFENTTPLWVTLDERANDNGHAMLTMRTTEPP